MARVIDPDTGIGYEVDDAHVQTYMAKGYTVEGQIALRDAEGLASTTSPDDLQATMRGKRLESLEEHGQRAEAGRIEREHGGVGGMAATALEAGADAVTFGGYSAGARALGLEENVRERRQANPGTALAGEIGGTVASTLLSGGAGLVGKAARLTPMGSLARAAAGRGIKGMAIEGAAMGAGQGVQEAMLSEDPLTSERFFSSVGSKALYGAALGGGIGVAGKAASLGITKSKAIIAKAQEAAAKRATFGDDLARMDKPGLEAAHRETVRELGGDVVARAQVMRESGDIMRATAGESKKVATSGRTYLRNHLDDPRGLAEKPGMLSKTLRKEEKLLREITATPAKTLESLARADAKVLGEFKEGLAALKLGKKLKLKGEMGALYGDVRDIAVSGKKGVKVSRDELARFIGELEAGAAGRMRAEAMEKMPALLDDNLRLQTQIDAIANNTAPKLAEIRAAMDSLSSGARKPGMLEQAAQGSIFGAVTGLAAPLGPLAPLLGGKVAGKVTDMVFGRMGRAATAAGERSTAAVDAFLDVGRKLGKAANPAATRILVSTAFGPEPGKLAQAMAKRGLASKPKTLLDAFKARSEEVLSQVQAGPTGPVMRAGARIAMAARLDGVRAADPVLADRLETHAARRLEFLASKLPRRPGITMTIGPDLWRPSDMAMRQWARYVSAVEDPGGVEERVADATVTPEDVEAVREVYPERYEDFKNQIIMRLPELRKQLPYAKRLSLSIYTGVPVDPALDPTILKILQGNFANETGTDGGTHAPLPSPQFGSIKKPDMTPAQERAQ